MNRHDYQVEPAGSSHGIIQYLDDKIYEYNASATQKKDGQTFSYIIRAQDSRIIAGVSGWTWAAACEILLLWVDDAFRKKGLGERLLKSAEEEAIRQGCKAIVVRSYSFQAPLFYQKHGYTAEHVMDNFPEEHKHYTLVKRLA